jgi:rhomboid protease GluP
LRRFVRWIWGGGPAESLPQVVLSTPVTWVLLTIITVVWVFDVTFPEIGPGIGPLTHLLGEAPARVGIGEWWRLATSTFVNPPITLSGSFTDSAFAHLSLNAISLAIAGPRVERRLGHYRFVVLFFVTTIVGSVLQFVVLPPEWVPNGGTSISVYGVFAALLVILYVDRWRSREANRDFIIAVLAFIAYPGLAVSIVAAMRGHTVTNLLHAAGFVVGTIVVAAWIATKRASIGTICVLVLLCLSAIAVPVRSASLDRMDASVVATIPMPANPRLVIEGLGAVFVMSESDGEVTRVDPASGEIEGTVDIASPAGGIAVSQRYVWVTARRSVIALDPEDLDVVSRVEVPADAWGIAFGDGAVWVSLTDRGEIVRIDERTGSVTDTVDVGGDPYTVVTDDRSVWTATYEGREVVRIDIEELEVAKRWKADADFYPYRMSLDRRSLWVVSGKQLVELDSTRLALRSQVAAPDFVYDVCIDRDGRMWLSHQFGGWISRLSSDPREIVRGPAVGLRQNFGLACDGEDIWVADVGRDELLRVKPGSR